MPTWKETFKSNFPLLVEKDIVKIVNESGFSHMLLLNGLEVLALLVYKEHRYGIFNHIELKYFCSKIHGVKYHNEVASQ